MGEGRAKGALERFFDAWPTWAPLLLMGLLYVNQMWTKQAANDEDIRAIKDEMREFRKQQNQTDMKVQELKFIVCTARPKPHGCPQ